MRRLYVALLLLIGTGSVAASAGAQVLYDHQVRRAPFREQGLALDGSSMPNFASEPEFAEALRTCFGFNDNEVKEAIAKCKRKGSDGMPDPDVELTQYPPRDYAFDMWGASLHKSRWAGVAFWMPSIEITVSSGKVAKFCTVCANPHNSPNGQKVPRKKVYVPIKGKTVFRDKEVEVPSSFSDVQYEDREVMRSFQTDTETIVRTVRGDTPQLGSAFGQVVGSPVTKINPAVYATWAEREKMVCKTTPPPGHGPGHPPPPPIVHRPGAPPTRPSQSGEALGGPKLAMEPA